MINRIKYGIIVSCQAGPQEPLYGSQYMAAMARAAERGGAAGIRANGPADVAAIKASTTLPVIGIYKQRTPGYIPFVTPTVEAALAVAKAGADAIALDATFHPRASGLTASELVARVKEATGLPVMADIATLEEGIAAARAGADLVATTLSPPPPSYPVPNTGYRMVVPEGPPDIELVARLADAITVPVIAEGRFWTPEQVLDAFRAGAWAVVVGTAITRPAEITHRFVRAALQWQASRS